jgi:LysR family hydrogen peroxide-inducible transcriptional activator
MSALPTLKQLKYLSAIAEHRHFGKAAQACFVSQSTLSAAILELEENLGVRLVERDKKNVHLTAVGRDVVLRAQQILTATQDLVAAANAAHEPFTTEMRLGVIPTIAQFILPGILKALRKQFPDFRLYIREDLSKPLVGELLSGELDLLLLALPYPAENVETLHLFYDEFLLAHDRNEQIGKPGELHTRDLVGQDLLLLEDGHCLRDHALDACKLKTGDIGIPFQATSLNTIIQMVANGIGITILPKMSVDAGILRGTSLDASPFSEAGVERSIGLMWRKQSPRETEFHQLGEIISRSAEK